MHVFMWGCAGTVRIKVFDHLIYDVIIISIDVIIDLVSRKRERKAEIQTLDVWV